MRVCASCGRENPDDRDFCECGEYLRWEPTGVVHAITPEVLQAAQQAPPAGAKPQAPAAQPATPPQKPLVPLVSTTLAAKPDAKATPAAKP